VRDGPDVPDALHPSAQRVADALLNAGVAGRVRQFHSSTRTAADAATALGCELGAIASCLVFMADGVPVVVITSGAHRVDTDHFADQVGVAAIRMATASEVRAATSQPIGGVAPVNWPARLRVYIDTDLEQYEVLWSAAGTPNAVFPTSFDELRRLTGAVPKAVARARS
jgi:prolyl-tRNA editing enzyme YbaK/EbsC (Cys-tRNA(Pro) deacylase)